MLQRRAVVSCSRIVTFGPSLSRTHLTETNTARYLRHFEHNLYLIILISKAQDLLDKWPTLWLSLVKTHSWAYSSCNLFWTIEKIYNKAYKIMIMFSNLGCHCLCTRVFVIILMFNEPQTEINTSINPYIRKDKHTNVGYKHRDN